MKFSDLKTKSKVLIGISTPLAFGLAIGGISGFSIDSIVESNKWVDHTRVVLADAAGIVGSAVDMETGMRGYLLAGEEGFLDPYSNGERATYSRIDALREIVNDNPAQVERLNQAERVLREWQKDVTEPTIALRREIGDAETMNDMADLVGEARGKVYFDKFREQITTFIARETTLLEARRAEFTAAQGQVDGNLELMQNTVGWVDHTNGVLAAAAQILAHAVDMETGMRGYLLAGEEEFLAPYNDGKQAFFAGVEALQRTVNDNPAAVARLGKARDLIQQWVNEVTEPAIALRRQVNDGVRSMDAVDAYVSRKAGKKFFDAFRAEIAAFSEAEIDLLAERKAATEAAEATMHADLATMKTNEEWVAHTYTVIQQADAILAAAVDMETGMRGYLLAGQDSFLDPYNAGAQNFFALIAELRDTVNDNPAQVQLLTAAEQTIRDWQENVTEPTIALRGQIGDAKNMADLADLVGEARGKQYFDRFRQIMTDFAAVETGLMETRKADNEATVSTTLILIAVFSVAALVIGLPLAWLIGNAIARPMRKMTDSVGALAGGAQDIELPNLEAKDEIGEMARSLLQIKEMGERAARAQAALTSASSPMMLISDDGEVIFANQEMHRLFDALAKDLAAELSGFSGREVVGARFDTLHNIREMSTQSLAAIDGQHGARMEIAGHTLDLAAGPVINEQGDRLGTVVEWSDMTQQVAIEQEVAGLVDAAAAGDFTRRLEEAGKEGFMLDLSKGMNQVVETVDRGLTESVEIMAALADGDLTKRMVGDYQGSFLKLKEDANRMAEQIGAIVGHISAATGSVRNAAAEIDLGASELSARAESQAASLEETAAAMEEMAATVKTNAENAIEANSLAEATRGQAERGREVVAETVQAMANIRESSTEIGDIVSTIEAIAFQTNLLALNAAVEAARAGDAGKGFAVVASEVRTLAQRSGDAAKTIKDLIGKSTGHVEAGDRLVGETDAALTEILEGVRNVARTIEEIADASKEQTIGVEEVSSTVSQMDEMTQQNASMADRSAAAARDLTEQSETLVELVRFFTIGGDASGSGAGARIGADRDQQAWDGDAKAETEAARNPVPAPRAAVAGNRNWDEF